jgi:hypothetical protein
MANDVSTDVIAQFGRKYLWWREVDGQPFSEDRIASSLTPYRDGSMIVHGSSGAAG